MSGATVKAQEPRTPANPCLCVHRYMHLSRYLAVSLTMDISCFHRSKLKSSNSSSKMSVSTTSIAGAAVGTAAQTKSAPEVGTKEGRVYVRPYAVGRTKSKLPAVRSAITARKRAQGREPACLTAGLAAHKPVDNVTRCGQEK